MWEELQIKYPIYEVNLTSALLPKENNSSAVG